MTQLCPAGLAHVRVPATSANLGPGYDALGLALALYDDVSAAVVGSGLTIAVAGEASANIPDDESHLIVRAMRVTFDRLDARAAGLRLDCTNRIPHGRGLGSSAAAICAGVLLARALVPGGDERMSLAQVLDCAAQIEGHPDNVAPCLLGGLTVAWTDAEPAGARAVRLEPAAIVKPVVFIPPFESSTEQARRLLPAEIAHEDAAFNAGRSALLVAALTGAPDVLLPATEDRLHQPYRTPAMPRTSALVTALRAAGVPAVVSGAGPTVLALCADAEIRQQAMDLAPADWRTAELDVDRAGATVRSG